MLADDAFASLSRVLDETLCIFIGVLALDQEQSSCDEEYVRDLS